MEDYFIINGKCSLEYGIVVKELPSITIPKRRVEEVTVLGRDGVLTVSDGTYEPINKDCDVWYAGDNPSELIDLLNDGIVTFSNLPDRFYNMQIISEIPIDKLFENLEYGELYNFSIKFRCQPFGYDVNNAEIILTESKTIYNYGYYSKPIITIYGNGDINLFIDEQQVNLKGVEEYITINSEKMRTYKDLQRQNDKKIGNFPLLKAGGNNISWSGNVSKVIIVPNFRWLV